LEVPLEPRLKPAFIGHSSALLHNAAMTRSDPPRSSALLRSTLAVLLGGLLTAAQASDHGDHERAREAVQSGQVLPLRTVLERLEREHPGEVLEVELEREHDRWVYEVKLLQRQGQLVKLKVDAQTAAVIRSRTRAGSEPARHAPAH
jgi:hypothetical protein